MLFFAFSCFASEARVHTGYLYVSEMNQSHSLSNILYYQAHLPKTLVNKKDFIDTILTYNPQILDPNKIKVGTRIYLEVPYETKLVQFVKRKKRQSSKERSLANTSVSKIKNRNDKNTHLKITNLSSFVTSSVGFHNETLESGGSVTNQNIPLTLGVAASVQLGSGDSIDSTFYISSVETAREKDGSKQTSIPLEYGATSYYKFEKRYFYIKPYTGIDLETFSIFNSDELALGEEFSTREHTFLYATLGVESAISFFKQEFQYRLGLSQSVYSASSRKSLASSKEFSGQKISAFVETKLLKNTSVHFSFKNHIMGGPSDLNISRYGVGLSYKFL